MTKLLVSVLMICLFTGCSSFEVKPFWGDAPQIGKENPETPGFDKDGNKIPSPEVLATYYFPDIHAGYAWVDGDKGKLTPTLGVEILEVKVPVLRWFSIQLGAGTDELHVYVGKRFTSVFEITAGPMFSRRFDEEEWSWGFGATVIKF